MSCRSFTPCLILWGIMHQSKSCCCIKRSHLCGTLLSSNTWRIPFLTCSAIAAAQNTQCVLAPCVSWTVTVVLQVQQVMKALLDHINRDSKLRKECAHKTTLLLTSHWTMLNQWWNENASLTSKTAAVELVKKMLGLHPNVRNAVSIQVL